MVELAKAQRQDPTLFPIHYLLESGKRDDTDYVLLWRAPRGWMYAIAVPCQLVPGMLVVVSGNIDTLVQHGRHS